MKTLLLILMATAAFYANDNGICTAQTVAGLPIAYIGGCEIDINGDQILDSALLIQTMKGYELIAIIRLGEKRMESYLVHRSEYKTFLTCEYGKEIKETDAGEGRKKGKIYQTNGAYLVLTQYESSSVAFFWSDGKFKEVWLHD